MDTRAQIDAYIASQPEAKRNEMLTLHQLIFGVSPDSQLSFLDGRNSDGKIVTNPNIGYGLQTIRYADGSTREFYKVGISANTAGISVYIVGLEDKQYLSQTYGKRLGKTKITGYCIKFRSLADIDIRVLEEMIAEHMAREPAHSLGTA
ncbi:MAG TPA: DUF1801 domain-containing protein [Phenylobacterium sp.]|nr:DUF1801 domain-containing protein [Phenylobacterium sp.]